MNRSLLKVIFLTFLSVSVTACAQSTNDKSIPIQKVSPSDDGDAFDEENFRHHPDLNLTADQVQEIERINKNIGAKFRAIGQNPSITGYEKGQQKKALALQLRKDIYNILTPEQRAKWEQVYGNTPNNSLKNNITEAIEDKLDVLEDKYKADKKIIERDDRLSNEEKKLKKKKLEAQYKQKKELLKREKDNVRNAPLLKGQ